MIERAITLSYPPSANRLWKKRNGRFVASEEAKAWKLETAYRIRSRYRIAPTEGPVKIGITLKPKQNKDGSASKTRLDLDNAIKATLDACNGVIWVDDKQVVEIYATIGEPVTNGGLFVTWGEKCD